MPSFDSVTIGLASPEQIRERSAGEVSNPRISPQYEKYEENGLFCERIFGPTKNYECRCGAYKGIRYNGVVCDQCGAEVSSTYVYRCQCGRCKGTGYRGISCPQCGTEVTRQGKRRSRMGHVSLCVPIVHSWYFKTSPCKIGHLLGLSKTDLSLVIYHHSYVVVQPGSARHLGVGKQQLLTEEEYFNVLSEIRDDNNRLPDRDPKKFIAKMGGEAIEAMLTRLDLNALEQELRYQASTETSQQRRDRALQRIEVVEAFRDANRDGENKPEWMVMRALPVLPPDLRPIVESDGNFVTSDLNDLYRNVLIRNDRLHRLIEVRAPEVILRQEKRMLQEAVDALIDNSRMESPSRGTSERPLKSLSDRLKGKEGRFRQNLIGKRVDYSGRSVIVSGPHLKLRQCGLPKEMAVELFKPFIIRRLIRRGVVKTKKSAEECIEERAEEVWDILEKVSQVRPVLLNRAPTLHRPSIQAFEPVLAGGKAIELHPLVCPAYNADFDGDEMAVHVPLSPEACLEATDLMLSSHNVLSPANGEPLAVPTQDMILGLYDLTKAKTNQKGEGMRFPRAGEVRQAYDQDVVGAHTKIELRDPDGSGGMLVTTVGRVLFNEVLPSGVGFVNEALTAGAAQTVIKQVLKEAGHEKTAATLDQMKRLGFEQATGSGRTFSLADIPVLPEKKRLIEEAIREVEETETYHARGLLTEDERYEEVISVWSKTTDRVSEKLFRSLEEDREGFNPIYMMTDSGARGSKEQIRQLGGMRGLMAKPQKNVGDGSSGEILENPVCSNFKEGLTVQEYFISTHGARKGLADTALRTADAGYLTRRLVDVGQRVVVTEQDCGALRCIRVEAPKKDEERDEAIARLVGRVLARDLRSPDADRLLAEAGDLIGESTAREIIEASIEKVPVRSVLTCRARRGVCALCYGRSLATQQMVEVGEPVGTVAAQAIGEPGTQLTLRTFLTGGVAGSDITGGLPRLEDLFEARELEDAAVASKIGGTVRFGAQDSEVLEIIITSPEGEREASHKVSSSRHLQVQEGDTVEAGDPLTVGTVPPGDILAIKGLRAAQKHLLREIQAIYRRQGVDVSEKHFECLLRQMTSRVKITAAGDAPRLQESPFVEGDLVRYCELTETNATLRDRRVVTAAGDADELTEGQLASPREIYKTRTEMEEHGTPGIETRPARLAVGQPVLLGLTKTALERASWIAAASFQNTTKVLSEAAIAAKSDPLEGIKENVVVGRPIPAGTGQGAYRGLDVRPAPENVEPQGRLPDWS